MRRLAILLLALLAGSVMAVEASTDSIAYDGEFPASTLQLEAASLTIGGMRRDVLVYRPSTATTRPPVLIFFSGTGATLGFNTADELGRDWLQAFADRERVVLLFPMPLVQTVGDWDNHFADTPYWQTALGEGSNAPVSAGPDVNPDLRFTRALIKESVRRYDADPSRIYASGFSNGAMFSYFAAAVLAGRIAAFAESGGGLVLSNTTAGDPEVCAPRVNSGTAGSLRSCAEAGWQPGDCQSAGAVPRPIAVPSTGRVPPAFLRANDDDRSVPYTHTCNLAAALSPRTEVVAAIGHDAGGHVVSQEFFESSWAFLREHRLPPETGWWWNAAESGRGFAIEVNGNTLFMASFLYDVSGRATWYVSGGPLNGDGSYVGTLQEFAGGQTLTGSYRPPALKANATSVSLTCATSTSCDLTWAGGTVPITRFVFDSATRPASAPETGWWWNATESGRGFFLEMQGTTLFASGYMYDITGNAIWYLASGAATATAFSGSWTQFGNGQTLTGSYVAPVSVNDNVGPVSIQLSSPTAGNLVLPDGRVVPITRFRF